MVVSSKPATSVLKSYTHCIIYTSHVVSPTFPLESCIATAVIGRRLVPTGEYSVRLNIPLPLDKEFKGVADKHLEYTVPEQTVKGKIYYVGEFPKDGSYHFAIHQYPHAQGGGIVINIYIVNLGNKNFIAAIFKGDQGAVGMGGIGKWSIINGISDQPLSSALDGDDKDPHVPVMIKVTPEKVPGGHQEVIVSPAIDSPFDEEFKGIFSGNYPIKAQETIGGLYYPLVPPSVNLGESYFDITQYKGDAAGELGRLVVEFYTKEEYTAFVNPPFIQLTSRSFSPFSPVVNHRCRPCLTAAMEKL